MFQLLEPVEDDVDLGHLLIRAPHVQDQEAPVVRMDVVVCAKRYTPERRALEQSSPDLEFETADRFGATRP